MKLQLEFRYEKTMSRPMNMTYDNHNPNHYNAISLEKKKLPG